MLLKRLRGTVSCLSAYLLTLPKGFSGGKENCILTKFCTLFYHVEHLESSKKGKKSSKRSGSEKDLSKHLPRPRRTTSSDVSIDKSDDGDLEENVRVSGRSLKISRSSRGAKEDKKPSVPRRDRSVGKPSSNRSLGKKSRHGDEDASDKQSKKSGRRARRVSPDSRTDDDDDLESASFHSAKKDSDKQRRRSRSSTSKKRTPTSSRKKAPAGAKLPRRKLKEKSSRHSDDTHVSVETETSDDMDEDFTKEISLNDEDSTPGSARTRCFATLEGLVVEARGGTETFLDFLLSSCLPVVPSFLLVPKVSPNRTV